ncbi:MAG: beta-propeller domain-containing protein, partial [Candidatus Korarchaeota archaeon]|nr:beta-propeller domain-containing protein [Candidatus Korarchaeota archaeon]
MDLGKAVTAMLVVALVVTGSLAAYSMSRGGETRTVTVTVSRRLGAGISVPMGDRVASFSSYEQLARYLEASSIVGSVSQAAGLPLIRVGYPAVESGGFVPAIVSPTAKGGQSTGAVAPGYSKTNIQVEGVDEAAIAKTDGTRIYVASGSRVWVLRAYPPSGMRVEGEVSRGKDARVRGLFVAGDRLVVLAERGLRVVPLIRADASVARAELSYGHPSTTIQVYSVPGLRLLYNVSLGGGYVTGRLINPTLYVVANQPVISVNGSLSIPSVNGEPLPPSSVYYFPEQMGMTYTLVLGMDLETGRHSTRALLTSDTS